MKTAMKHRRTYLVDDKTMENIKVIQNKGYNLSFLIRKWIVKFARKSKVGEK